MKRLITIAACCILLASCGSSKKATVLPVYDFPAISQGGKTAIVAHRGFWQCEESGYAQNSIAALKRAQECGLWGSEFDIHITSDDVVIVNHDPAINKIRIHSNPYSAFKDCRLKNGETIPTLDEYLTQGEKCKTTMLVIEFKKHGDPAREDLLVEKTVAALKAHHLFSPKRVAFISFSKHVCDVIAKSYPKFINQYLNGDIAPAELAKDGINGFDYRFNVVFDHPEWTNQAKGFGMSTNCWTVKPEDMKAIIENGVHAITTNEPLILREMLGDKEFRQR